MSQALASARKRRGVPQTTTEVTSLQNSNQLSNASPSTLTLPQVIALIDKRLTTLEYFMKETKETSNVNSSTNKITLQNEFEPSNLLVEEFNHRFELLVEEMNNIKDIVLKLQSYTMEVNKTLLEERINVFSDLGNVINNNDNIHEIQNVNDVDLTSFSLKNLVQEKFEGNNDL